MKEKSSIQNKMIDRNWVTKRKRKRHLPGPDQASGKESVSLSSESQRNNAFGRLKNESSMLQSPHKKKGNDGYYFECVVCDLRGNLLCCDSCPRTYHLQCLNPPLKRAPPGKWQCPNCSEQNDPIKSIGNSESISKRARTKSNVHKSQNEAKSSGSEKITDTSDSGIPVKNGSSSKGKSTLLHKILCIEMLDSPQADQSPRTKSSHSSHGGNGGGASPCANIDTEKGPNVSCNDSSGNRKSSSPAKEVQVAIKISDFEPNVGPLESKSNLQSNDGPSEANPNLEPNDEPNSESKPNLLHGNAIPENKLESEPAGPPKRPEKRKRAVDNADSHKKTSANKGKHAVKSFKSGKKPTSSSPGSGKSRKKRTSIEHKVSISPSKESLGSKPQGVRQKELKCPEDSSCSQQASDATKVDADKAVTVVDKTPVDVHQVDRILGCRVNCADPVSAPIKQTAECSASRQVLSENLSAQGSNDMPSLVNPANHERLLDVNLAVDRIRGPDGADNLSSSIKKTNGERTTENNIKVDKLHVYRRNAAKKGTEGGLTGKYLKGRCLKSVSGNGQDNSNGSIDDAGKLTGKVETNGTECANLSSDSKIAAPDIVPVNDEVHVESSVKTNMNKITEKVENTGSECADLKNINTNSAPENCDTPDPLGNCNKDADQEARPISTSENKIHELALVGAIQVKDSSNFEFLVKWAGRSHVHNTWVSEEKLKVLAKRKLENFKAKYGTAVINVYEEEWSQPQRVLALRTSNNDLSEAFIKWYGLPYDECTWERLEEPVMKRYAHLIAKFQESERQALEKSNAKDDPLIRQKRGQQTEIIPLVEQPVELKGGSLFPHQLEALNWLRKCWHKSKNVILADEMGLGKTVSACAFISSLYFEFKVRLPCLVLVPLSTMPNWLSEFALWAPNLNVVEYHGCAKARSVIRQYEWHASDPDGLDKKNSSYRFNVLLTTYEMVLADSSHLRGVPWEVLVVDEGHRLKNSGSKLFSMLNTFSFQHRVLLTGTPLQNNIGEMYNLLNFLQPASFPSLSSFEENFNDLTSAEKVDELKKLVAPHMLRRLKKDVMQNIPPKTERMVPVELSSIQAEYYRAMLTKNYQVLRNIGKGVAQQSMLNIVMQLRKVCNHPYLIPGTEPDSGSVEFLQEMRIKASAKLTLLHSMLKVLNKEGHRVLIFSQMTKLLDILEDYLTIEYGPKTFERVDGSVSVTDRQAAIARFNQDKTRFVFLLSTRSCGLGINLATADTVIIYDSDFNPHADIQAMNRAHRIGQSNRLLVYRLVVRASVEERILQLAKKKLMLDQLFVNKSESQKEVEDILRWGTEELFSDSVGVTEKDKNGDPSPKDESITETEHKHRRKTGGLGDVYKDKCTDGSTKIVWDESALTKLLDRSVLHTGSSEGAEGELDNDMLGSVKSLEWNDDTTEEPGTTESPPAVADDASVQISEKTDDQLLAAEENEWDRLLRVRWEKYQSEEEAALGRGKRIRKAVSYSEVFAIHPNEALIENGTEEGEQEPEREYTPAGRALKAKYAKLRARQKERLARRGVMKEACLTEQRLGPDQPSQFLGISANGGENSTMPIENGAQALVIDLDAYSTEAPKYRNDLSSKSTAVSKQGCKVDLNAQLDLSVIPSDFAVPSHQSQSSSCAVPANNLLPVLGLCAPNANQLESAHRNRSECFNLPKSSYSQSRASKILPDFPFRLSAAAGTSGDAELKGHESAGDACALLDAPPDFSKCRLNSILDSCFSSNSYRLSNTQGRVSGPSENPGITFPSFREKLGLPNLCFEETHASKFSLPTKNAPKSYPEFFPNLSLGTHAEPVIPELPAMPLLPDFRLPSQETHRHNQQLKDVNPTLALGQSAHSSLSESQKKVLDNIMMRTGSGISSFGKRSKLESWSENELDTLWIGVRRHGKGNWDTMLRDPKLKFSKYKCPEDLAVRWEQEQVKVFGDAVRSKSGFKSRKSTKSSLFSGISDGMMTRALQGSRFSGFGAESSLPPIFQSHLTDIQLGFGDHTAGMAPVEPPYHFAFPNERFAPFPSWKSDKFQSHFPGDSSAGSSDRPGPSSNFNLEQPLLLNSLASSDLSNVGINHPSSSDFNLPTPFDRSLNFLPDFPNYMHKGGSTSTGLLPDTNKELKFSRPAKDDVAGSSNSNINKLPHWLRDAVSVPAKPAESDLPPTVSAIAQSVRLLYGEEQPAIPPFNVPGPPPSVPKDPRRSQKKKGKLHKVRRESLQIIAVREDDASSSIPVAPPSQPTMTRPPGFPPRDPTHALSALNLNLNSPSPFVTPFQRKKLVSGLSPSPDVLQLVASCVGSGSNMPAAPGTTSSDFLGNDMSVPMPLEHGGDDRIPEFKDLPERQLVQQSGLGGSWSQLPSERTGQADSGDSSETHSDPRQIKQPKAEEVSSEETVSDDHGSDKER
ncbi:hypothetical protein Sjap_003626 [Stephania japonica]|uniref:Protein CHROMATIN REMODELING 4 n=1 Tax=Stephania japonica TaxID=461633 RepID=A0AAP0PXC4_9MAGN